MSARIVRPLALALTVASVAFAAPARAQATASASLTPVQTAAAPAPAPATAATATPAPAGPTMEAASVAVRHAPATDAAPARRGGYGQPVALMVVGGGALLTGLIIGGDAGTVIAIGGTVMGLYGLYEYLQ